MKARIITAIVALCLFVPVCIFSGTVVFPIAFAVLSLCGTYEMIRCVGAHKKYGYSIPLCILAAAAPIFCYYSAQKDFHWSDVDFYPDVSNTHGFTKETFTSMLVIQLVVMIVLLLAAVVRRGKDSVTEMSALYMLTSYVVLSFASIVLLRAGYRGNYLYLLVFIGSWVSDTGAWFFGRLFGKHKLIPEVSPKKTVEGAVGGVLSAALAFVLYGFIIHRMDAALSPNYLILAVSGVICAIVSQFGDLIASLVKRHYGIKDYGNVFPGHGGVMDRFDSVLLVSPVLYLLITYIPNFVLF